MFALLYKGMKSRPKKGMALQPIEVEMVPLMPQRQPRGRTLRL
jgi:hypothetical protein